MSNEKRVLTDLIDLRTGKSVKLWLTKNGLENLGSNYCLPYEYEGSGQE